ncbi:MAG: S8 family serine peptidase [Chloroflexi bacterium]|nr:S8 family serine peptidase [Chloroflexota bacterium]
MPVVQSALGVILFCALLVGVTCPSGARAEGRRDGVPNPECAEDKLAAVRPLLAGLDAGETVTVIVLFRDPEHASGGVGRATGEQSRAERLSTVVKELQARAAASQRSAQRLLRARGLRQGTQEIVTLWMINGLGVTAPAEVIYKLAELPEVVQVLPNREIVGRWEKGRLSEDARAPEREGNAPTWNLAHVGAPALWQRGLLGEGIVVASLDTGVDVDHPDLVEGWRGGGNSWFDPYGEFPSWPVDVDGHGTAVMGVMVGRARGCLSQSKASEGARAPEEGGIGVAPGAQWIAARIFRGDNKATALAIHQAFQWLLDPDGNPDTPDAPHVVNGSWSLAGAGCALEFQRDVRALREAGILPVFAAGNAGPGPATSTSPANYPEAFAVGATDERERLYEGSSRGPAACGGEEKIFPDLVAPGVLVRTTGLQGGYTYETGTSMAAPHVAGGLALLLSAFPDLDADEQAELLRRTAADLGPPGADNESGYGRLDLLAAYRRLSSEVVVSLFLPQVGNEAPLIRPYSSYLPLIWSAQEAIERRD